MLFIFFWNLVAAILNIQEVWHQITAFLKEPSDLKKKMF